MRLNCYLLLLLLWAAPFSAFTQTVFMEVSGASQGDITQDAGGGDSVSSLFDEAHPNESYIFASEFTSDVPIDPNTGATTGSARPCAYKIKKVTDKASPLLFQAMVTEENLEVTFRYWRTSLAGTQEQYYTIRITGAKIISFRTLTQEEPLEVSGIMIDHFEEIAFIYSDIEITHETAGTSASNDF